ncbi:uncharacterized protein LOC117783687 [Drosophila innubila]|uniref:uncharacterized protein LOC117783687 n=1 Tax=Drosophila innubila TaxID=198719 RepID=UPI00148C7051|nr:uncharacterized protein LOC117783687 [Drosophila innubila]
MLSMTHFLLLSVIIASLYLPAHGGETSNDYEDYDGDDSSHGPGHLQKPTPAPLIPYFNEGQVVVYVNSTAKSVKLDCPVQNYDAKSHVIMWYKDEKSVSTGDQLSTKEYTIDKQFALTIPVENATSHNYSCWIMPSKVRRNITVEFQTPNGASSISWPNTLYSIILSVFALIYPLASRF